jgi:hypothetical protein
MTNNDSTDLQSTLSDDELVDRFAMVHLYFVTGGARWEKNQAGFLAPFNTCSWNNGKGVLLCNGEGSVVWLIIWINFPIPQLDIYELRQQAQSNPCFSCGCSAQWDWRRSSNRNWTAIRSRRSSASLQAIGRICTLTTRNLVIT